MSQVRIAREERPQDADVRFLQDAIDAYNVEKTKRPDYLLVTFSVRDDDDRIVGGIVGDIWGDWLYVRVLWLEEERRLQGYGTQLLRAAEEVAIQQGCRNVYLSTFSFEAPRFYEKLGYEIFGTLEDFPPGHTKFYMRKSLAPALG